MLPLKVLFTRKNPTKVSALLSAALTAGSAALLNLTDKPQPTLALLGVEMRAAVTPCDTKKLYARILTFRDLYTAITYSIIILLLCTD